MFVKGQRVKGSGRPKGVKNKKTLAGLNAENKRIGYLENILKMVEGEKKKEFLKDFCEKAIDGNKQYAKILIDKLVPDAGNKEQTTIESKGVKIKIIKNYNTENNYDHSADEPKG